MKTGNGKIAHLPPDIQDELNYRITDGESGNELAKRAERAGGLSMEEASGDPENSQDFHSSAPASTFAETPPTCKPSPTAKNVSPTVHPQGATPQGAEDQPSRSISPKTSLITLIGLIALIRSDGWSR